MVLLCDVIGAHGFNVSDGGRGGFDKTYAVLEELGFTVHQADYGWVFLFRVRRRSYKTADRIVEMTKLIGRPCVGIGHSNGCNILDLAAHKGANFSRLIYFSPALNRSTKLAPQVKRCDVFHTASDLPTKLATFIPFSRWGRMGAKGYKGRDARYVNRDCSQMIKGHSGWFTEQGLKITEGYLKYLLGPERKS